MMSNQKHVVSVRLPLELYQKLRIRAEESNRTLPRYICLILTRYVAYVEKHGDQDKWLFID